jgi:hypothetical protein
VELVTTTDIDPEKKTQRQYVDGKREEVVQPGDAVSSAANEARERVFLDQMSGAFSKVFPSGLLTLKALGPNETQEGKIIFAAKANTSRTDGIFNLREEASRFPSAFFDSGRLIARLNGLRIDWQFVVINDGKILYRDRSRSNPAEQIGVPRDTDGPGAYRYMLDSAYENYADLIISKFGVQPESPPSP